jgi:hypothetical protein
MQGKYFPVHQKFIDPENSFSKEILANGIVHI